MCLSDKAIKPGSMNISILPKLYVSNYIKIVCHVFPVRKLQRKGLCLKFVGKSVHWRKHIKTQQVTHTRKRLTSVFRVYLFNDGRIYVCRDILQRQVCGFHFCCSCFCCWWWWCFVSVFVVLFVCFLLMGSCTCVTTCLLNHWNRVVFWL